MPARAEMEQELRSVVAELGDDELEVLALVARGMRAGRDVYRALQVAEDRRDFVHETLEEVRDGLVYVGSRLLQLSKRRTRPCAPSLPCPCREKNL